MNARMLVAAIAAAIAMTASAKVTVSGVFSKNMVLPRDREVPVWGKADPGEKVKVAFTDKSATATADAEGYWCATLPPLAASCEPQVLTITSQPSQSPLAFANVLVGDVFLYAGSTAADSRFSWEQEKKFDWTGEIGRMDLVKGVRFLMQRMVVSLVPTTYSVDAGAWFTPSSKPGIWQGCPVFPWLFASAYVTKTGVPCGVVTASMPWRQNEMFISPAAMADDPAYAKQLSAYLKLLGGFAGFGAGCNVKADAADDMPYATESRVEPDFKIAQNHNAMIRPVLKFAFKGAIWFPEPKEGWRSDDDYARINRNVMAGMVPLGVKEFPVFAINPKKDRVESAEELVKLFADTSAPKTAVIAAAKTDAEDDAAKPPEAFSVSKLFADNMVLQRGMPVPVWGKAKPGTIVKVLFAEKSATAKANAAGDWCATLPPLEMSAAPQALTVAHQTSQTFSNVLVGDVWYASGQSNAEMSFNWGL
ncbi:MAG TPA: hypothetical protein PKI32_03655, partial [Opitutales bacterium]|nr:hypothetical protein [Opitutales bacterium]